MENKVLHKAETRGHENHGWLDTYHTFSFADYYNPDRMSFGALRVLNDDSVEAGMGFNTHPHKNMEIISIPLEGDLQHRDSMGNGSVIRYGDVQVMSAGTGIYHSEFNSNKDRKVKFLQIWIIPEKQNVAPRYGQITLNADNRHNKLQQVLSPNKDDEGVWIYQKAWFHMGIFDKGTKVDYTLKLKGNGIYLFNISGEFKINDEKLMPRDGLGLWDIGQVQIIADSDSEILLVEIPMNY